MLKLICPETRIEVFGPQSLIHPEKFPAFTRQHGARGAWESRAGLARAVPIQPAEPSAHTAHAEPVTVVGQCQQAPPDFVEGKTPSVTLRKGQQKPVCPHFTENSRKAFLQGKPGVSPGSRDSCLLSDWNTFRPITVSYMGLCLCPRGPAPCSRAHFQLFMWPRPHSHMTTLSCWRSHTPCSHDHVNVKKHSNL